MTARMMHLAMWYAGHDPRTAADAALARGGSWEGYGFAETFFAHLDAWFGRAEAS